jgi:hypothetical protein
VYNQSLYEAVGVGKAFFISGLDPSFGLGSNLLNIGIVIFEFFVYIAVAIVGIRALKATALTLILGSLFLSSAGSAEVGMGRRKGFGDAAEGSRVGLKNRV